MLVFTFVTNSGKVMGDFASDRKALVLGAGYVSAPVVEYLTRDSGLGITVAAALKSEADKVKWENNNMIGLSSNVLLVVCSDCNEP